MFAGYRRVVRVNPFPFARQIWALALICLVSVNVSCMELPSLTSGRIDVLVVMGGEPVENARVRVWWLDVQGRPLNSRGEYSDEETLDLSEMMAMGYTDSEGHVTLDIGPVAGTILLNVDDGETDEPWGDDTDGGMGADGGVPGNMDGELEPPIDNGLSLWTVVTDHSSYLDEIQTITVSPLTTMAFHLGQRRLARGNRESTYTDAMRSANALLGEHFGDIDITRTHPSALEEGDDLRALEDEHRYGLVLHALASLARDMAEASGVTARGFSTMELVEALVEDASDDLGLLDGVGPNGPLTVAACLRPPGCEPDDREGFCHTICDLDANTLRTDLAQALAFHYLLSADNDAGLTYWDVRILIQNLAINQEPDLFGVVPIEPIQGPVPVLSVETHTMYDESRDLISFDVNSTPMHTSSGEPIELGPETTHCPTVYKYTHRLDDPDDNPLRWIFTVTDRSGTGVAMEMGQYRLRRTDAPEDQWLTDWLPATPVADSDEKNGTVEYEVTLLSDNVPGLFLDEIQGELEIAFRGTDMLGTSTPVVRRCWKHEPLAAPLEVSDVDYARGAGSLDAVGLDPENNLAPLLNGVSLNQGKAALTFTVLNGTSSPVYLSLSYEQPLVDYTKCWQRTNALLSTDDEPDPGCLLTGDCIADFPLPRRSSTVIEASGTIDDLISGLRIWDTTFDKPVELLPCPECQPNQYRLEPHLSLIDPRTYQIELVVSDLGALAPRMDNEQPELYEDTALDPPLAIPISGRLYDGITVKCSKFGSSSVDCQETKAYRHYSALTFAELSGPPLKVFGKTSPALALLSRTPPTQENTFGLPVVAPQDFHWITREQDGIPAPEPATGSSSCRRLEE